MIPHFMFAALLLAAPGLFAVLRPGRCQARIQGWRRRGFWLWPSAWGIAVGAFLLHASHHPLRLDAVSLLGWCISAAALTLLALPSLPPETRGAGGAASLRTAGAVLLIAAAALMALGLGAIPY